jgi:hypothetical protein
LASWRIALVVALSHSAMSEKAFRKHWETRRMRLPNTMYVLLIYSLKDSKPIADGYKMVSGERLLL